MVKVGLINYGSGNYTSVLNALEYLNIQVIEVHVPDQLHLATHIILPGVGSFKNTMNKLKEHGFIDVLQNEVLNVGKPYLGICVGMQILATTGTEFGIQKGLNFIPGVVEKISVDANTKLPHIGWNTVNLQKEISLYKNIHDNNSFYFVHSYHFVPENNDHLIATCFYSSEVNACVGKDNIYGVQFHPEKSQNNGLQLLKNFITI